MFRGVGPFFSLDFAVFCKWFSQLPRKGRTKGVPRASGGRRRTQERQREFFIDGASGARTLWGADAGSAPRSVQPTYRGVLSTV